MWYTVRLPTLRALSHVDSKVSRYLKVGLERLMHLVFYNGVKNYTIYRNPTKFQK